MWTIHIHGEAHEVFGAMLQTLGAGYVLGVAHRDLEGDAVFVACGARSLTVRPYDPDNETEGEPIDLDWEGLDALEVY